MANFTRNGYGQVEPNQLSAQKTGQIYASLPLDNSVTVLQNGEFMFYDYATGKVTATDSTGVAEPMLVFNEIKLYEPFWRTSYKDFAMIRVDGKDASGNRVPGENYVTSKLATAGFGDGATNTGVPANPGHTEYPYRMDGMAPRLLKTNIGDIYTTNMVATGVEYSVGDKLTPKAVTNTVDGNTFQTLVLTKDNTATKMVFVVVKVYTMPDGQPGLKLQRVA
jgi:hypothetical protein